MISIICPICNKAFEVKESRINRSKHDVCCSKACSNKLKSSYYLGKDNPNCKYEYNRDYFKVIDTDLKAYILGWVASDGNLKKDTVCIKIHKKDKHILNWISSETNGMLKYRCNAFFAKGLIFSSEIVQDICSHLKIKPGKKDSLVKFPDLYSNELSWAFLRGYFDGDGSIRHPGGKDPSPQCNISSTSEDLLKEIKNFCGIACYTDNKNKIEWYGNNAIDFLGKLYDNAPIFLNRKRDLYTQISMWVPSLRYGNKIRSKEENFYWSKTKDNAVAPYKAHASDSGFDLTLVEKVKTVGEVEYYTTNLKIRPAYGWYFDLVPRSSMPKSGYCLANDIGVIDRSYTGPIIAALRKFDKSAKDLELPARIVQIIPRQIVNPQIIYVDDFDETIRGSGGFGSTGV